VVQTMQPRFLRHDALRVQKGWFPPLRAQYRAFVPAEQILVLIACIYHISRAINETNYFIQR